MKCKIYSCRCNNDKRKKIHRKSHAIVKKETFSIEKLPRELIDKVVEILSVENKKRLRATSRNMKAIVDDDMRRSFKKWTNLNGKDLRTQHFTANGFTPPILTKLMKFSDYCRLQNLPPLSTVSESEHLLSQFYNQAKGNFDEVDMKILFTLTMLDCLKSLSDGAVEMAQSLDRQVLNIRFKITEVYFAVIWARKSYSRFTFENDCTTLLNVFNRLLVIKEALRVDPDTSDINKFGPLDVGDKLLQIGSRVKFNRKKPRSPGILSVEIEMQANSTMIQAFQRFVKGEAFDWESADESMNTSVVFRSLEAQKCGGAKDYNLDY